MLVLSRRENEQIVFPTLDITVNVTGCTNKSVRLGIEAPRHIRIVRGELDPLTQTPITVCPLESRSRTGADPLLDAMSEPSMKTEDTQSQLDTIKLAVQLAQTQLNHGREQRCQDALVYALKAIDTLESSIALSPPANEWGQAEPATETVHEARCGYRVGT